MNVLLTYDTGLFTYVCLHFLRTLFVCRPWIFSRTLSLKKIIGGWHLCIYISHNCQSGKSQGTFPHIRQTATDYYTIRLLGVLYINAQRDLTVFQWELASSGSNRQASTSIGFPSGNGPSSLQQARGKTIFVLFFPILTVRFQCSAAPKFL